MGSAEKDERHGSRHQMNAGGYGKSGNDSPEVGHDHGQEAPQEQIAEDGHKGGQQEQGHFPAQPFGRFLQFQLEQRGQGFHMVKRRRSGFPEGPDHGRSFFLFLHNGGDEGAFEFVNQSHGSV